MLILGKELDIQRRLDGEVRHILDGTVALLALEVCQNGDAWEA